MILVKPRHRLINSIILRKGQEIIYPGNCIITGESYLIGGRKYSLSGRGISCRLTIDGNLIPLLRRATGFELKVVDNELWPRVIKL